jgi:hypothetical protein
VVSEAQAVADGLGGWKYQESGIVIGWQGRNRGVY